MATATKKAPATPLRFKKAEQDTQVRLDLGAGKGTNTPEGFVAVDLMPWEGVQRVDLCERFAETELQKALDVGRHIGDFKPWPWADSSVDEVRCVYLIQYLTASERVHFFNELHRVLKPGATARCETPYWCAARAYTDIRIQWPPVAEPSYFQLSRAWRDGQPNVDTSGFTCDFDPVIGYGMHPAVSQRHTERAQEMMQWSKEAVQELIVTLTKV